MAMPPYAKRTSQQAAKDLQNYTKTKGADLGKIGKPSVFVRQAQTDMGGLTVDGIYGPSTKKRMETLLKAPPAKAPAKTPAKPVAKKAAPVKKAVPAKKAAPVKKSAPTTKASPIKKVAAATKKSAPAKTPTTKTAASKIEPETKKRLLETLKSQGLPGMPIAGGFSPEYNKADIEATQESRALRDQFDAASPSMREDSYSVEQVKDIIETLPDEVKEYAANQLNALSTMPSAADSNKGINDLTDVISHYFEPRFKVIVDQLSTQAVQRQATSEHNKLMDEDRKWAEVSEHHKQILEKLTQLLQSSPATKSNRVLRAFGIHL